MFLIYQGFPISISGENIHVYLRVHIYLVVDVVSVVGSHWCCCRFDDCVEGGESLIVDVFKVASEFRHSHPKEFEALATIPVTFQKIHYGRYKLTLHVYPFTFSCSFERTAYLLKKLAFL